MIQQLNGQTQRLLGQQSLAAYTGLQVGAAPAAPWEGLWSRQVYGSAAPVRPVGHVPFPPLTPGAT